MKLIAIAALLAVGASAFTTPDRMFKDGDAPKCFVIGGQTIVQYDQATRALGRAAASAQVAEQQARSRGAARSAAARACSEACGWTRRRNRWGT